MRGWAPLCFLLLACGQRNAPILPDSTEATSSAVTSSTSAGASSASSSTGSGGPEVATEACQPMMINGTSYLIAEHLYPDKSRLELATSVVPIAHFANDLGAHTADYQSTAVLVFDVADGRVAIYCGTPTAPSFDTVDFVLKQ